MTDLLAARSAVTAPPAQWSSRLRRLAPQLAPQLATVLAAIAFVAVDPPVGDLWAARARQYGAARGAVWRYWFSWFDGSGAPIGYSVITPYLSTFIGAAALAALATVVTVALVPRAVRGAPHPLAATWVAALTCSLDMWSGRVPFAVGTAFALGALLAVRSRRWWLAAPLGVLASCGSPVAGALLLVALCGAVVVPRFLAAALAAAAGAGAVLAAVAVGYGSPGDEPLQLVAVRVLCLALLGLVVARPPRYVVIPVVVSIGVYVALLAHPNAVGGNFNRLVWIWLPIAVVATARRALPETIAAASLAIMLGAQTTAIDLTTAASPVSATAQYAPLRAELARLPGARDYRVEAVADGTHDAAFELLGRAYLAGGYETQVAGTRNAVLTSPMLDAVTYRSWLDENSVGVVVLHRIALSETPEYTLVQQGLPYLHRVWADRDWLVFRVTRPVPLVPAPARIVDADQSNLVVDVRGPAPSRVVARVAWSSSLALITTDGTVVPRGARRAPHGWTRLAFPRPGRFVLRAR